MLKVGRHSIETSDNTHYVNCTAHVYELTIWLVVSACELLQVDYPILFQTSRAYIDELDCKCTFSHATSSNNNQLIVGAVC